MEPSSEAGALALDTVALEHPLSAAALAKYNSGMREVVEAAEIAVAEVGALEPCSAGPIPSLHLADCLRPFQQRPWEPDTEESLHLTTSGACPAQSSSALNGGIPVSSSPLLASVCPLQPWLAASFSWTLPRLATAVEGQAAAPVVGLAVVELSMTAAGMAAAASWPRAVAGRDEEWTSALPWTEEPREWAEIYWRPERDQPPAGRNESWMVE